MMGFKIFLTIAYITQAGAFIFLGIIIANPPHRRLPWIVSFGIAWIAFLVSVIIAYAFYKGESP